MPARMVSNSSNETLVGKQNEETVEPTFFRHLCLQLNESCKHQPAETVTSIMSLEMLSIYGVYQLIQISDMTFPLEFAIAFVINRFVRRFRFPIDIVNARVLASLLPPLKEVKILGSIPQIEDLSKKSKMTDIFNNYGLCYLIASRFGGVVSVCTIYMCLRYGVDVEPFVDWVLSFTSSASDTSSDTLEVVNNQTDALSTETTTAEQPVSFWEKYNVGEVAGSWAGAVVLSSVLSPAVYLGAPYLATPLHRLRQQITSRLRK